MRWGRFYHFTDGVPLGPVNYKFRMGGIARGGG